jgi:ribosomal RNA assembly protein
MTKQIYCENPRKIFQNKKAIETAFRIKLLKQENIIKIEGEESNEFTALQALEAIDMGFAISDALLLKEEDFIFEKIKIKSISHRRNLSQVRGRIIGEERKVLNNIEYLSDTNIVLHDNLVGIIGLSDNVRKASYALKKLIAGSKHANVYRYLEEEKAKERVGFV